MFSVLAYSSELFAWIHGMFHYSTMVYLGSLRTIRMHGLHGMHGYMRTIRMVA